MRNQSSLASLLAGMGRGGDTILAHINPMEARLLDAVTDGGSINPRTGLLEFYDKEWLPSTGSNGGTSFGSGYSSGAQQSDNSSSSSNSGPSGSSGNAAASSGSAQTALDTAISGLTSGYTGLDVAKDAISLAGMLSNVPYGVTSAINTGIDVVAHPNSNLSLGQIAEGFAANTIPGAAANFISRNVFNAPNVFSPISQSAQNNYATASWSQVMGNLMGNVFGADTGGMAGTSFGPTGDFGNPSDMGMSYDMASNGWGGFGVGDMGGFGSTGDNGSAGDAGGDSVA